MTSKRLLIALTFCIIALMSCSATMNGTSTDTEQSEFTTALQNNEINVLMIRYVSSASKPPVDITGGTFIIRIRGEKAKGCLPILTSSTPYDDIEFSHPSTKIAEFDCKKIKEKKKYVTYLLTDPYGSMGFQIKVICYYTGMATVILESNLAYVSSYKIESELEIPTEE